MDLTPIEQTKQGLAKLTSFEEAKKVRDELLWQQLDKITVEDAVTQWLVTLSPRTGANYQSGMRKLAELKLIDPSMSLQAFALLNHDAILDRIKLVQEWTECSRQARAACYISFTRFLARRTQGMIKRAIPNREGNAKTFFRVYEKVDTSAMTQAQWVRFFEALEKISPREALIAKVILQGGKRVSEVLSLQVNQIDWERKKITFVQSKTKGLKKETIITYPESIMLKLRKYIGTRTGYVFVTRFGRPVRLNRLITTFAAAGIQSGLPFKVTPHVLRASAVTYLKQQGFADSDIMKITGHANSAMVHAYDKSSRENNPTEKVWLVS
ncbi:MAG TPA: site-specific integrase [Candidatus Babeliaceae bacterium]|nr:site-specific integrase [Candidatus Babeliaceae bacterium]